MAAWQYDVYLVPGEGVTGMSSQKMRRDPFLWRRNTAIDDFVRLLNPTLPEAKSWDEEHVRIWGQENNNCINLICEDGIVQEVLVRFDTTRISIEFVGMILSAAEKMKCMMVEENTLFVYSPNLSDFNKRCRMSAAFQYAIDPTAYIEKLQ